MTPLPTTELERRIEEATGLPIAAQRTSEGLSLVGAVSSDREHEAVLEVVRTLTEEPVSDGIEVRGDLPDLEARGADAGAGAPGAPVEPGDFTSQPRLPSMSEALGASTSSPDDPAAEGNAVYTPPTDPVGTNTEVIGGLQATSMDDVSVTRSADGRIGDEALRDAVLRELREDAMTTALDVRVAVDAGVVRLEGTVADLDDATAAQAVAARVEGVAAVDERLRVERL